MTKRVTVRAVRGGGQPVSRCAIVVNAQVVNTVAATPAVLAHMRGRGVVLVVLSDDTRCEIGFGWDGEAFSDPAGT